MRVRGAHWLDYNYLHDNFPRHAKVSITSALGKVSAPRRLAHRP
jgi:hypothetical protein